jgi:hypothetical protein
MQFNLTIDVALILKARQLTGVSSDTELLDHDFGILPSPESRKSKKR